MHGARMMNYFLGKSENTFFFNRELLCLVSLVVYEYSWAKIPTITGSDRNIHVSMSVILLMFIEIYVSQYLSYYWY
jgi:hypothetical protein